MKKEPNSIDILAKALQEISNGNFYAHPQTEVKNKFYNIAQKISELGVDIESLIHNKESIMAKAGNAPVKLLGESYSKFFSDINDGWYCTDLEGNYINCNAAFEQITGYSEPELKKMNFKDLDPVKRPNAQDKILQKRIPEEKQSDIYETSYRRKDGQVVPVDLSEYVLQNHQGKAVGRWGLVKDVSSRKEVEKGLNIFHEFASFSTEGFGITDINGKIIYVNGAFLEIIGYKSDEEIKGKTLIQFYNTTSQIILKNEVLPHLMKIGHWKGELELMDQNSDKIRYTHENYFIIKDQNKQPQYIATIITDITSRKKAEKKLFLYQNNLEKLVKARTKELTISNTKLKEEVSERGRIEAKLKEQQTKLKTYFEELTKLTNNKVLFSGLIRESFSTLTRISAHTLNISRVSIWLYNEKKTGIICSQMYELEKDRDTNGTELFETDAPSYFKALKKEMIIDVEDAINDYRTRELAKQYLSPFNITSILDVPIRQAGKTIGVICYEHTGKEKKWTIEEINFAVSISDFLLFILEVNKRKKTEKELLETNNLKDLLLDVITHDLRNPIGALEGLSTLLQDHSEQNEIVTSINQIAQKAIDVIENATTLSKVTLGDEIEKKVLPLDNLILCAIEEFKSSMEHYNIELLYQERPIDIYANPIILEIFKNYISNAIQYAGDGKKIKIDVLDHKDHVIVKVSDWGETIPKEYRNKIFERKYQINKKISKGSGLGLAIVKRIAQIHNANVWVEPNMPHGNSFCLEIEKC